MGRFIETTTAAGGATLTSEAHRPRQSCVLTAGLDSSPGPAQRGKRGASRPSRPWSCRGSNRSRASTTPPGMPKECFREGEWQLLSRRPPGRDGTWDHSRFLLDRPSERRRPSSANLLSHQSSVSRDALARLGKGVWAFRPDRDPQSTTRNGGA